MEALPRNNCVGFGPAVFLAKERRQSQGKSGCWWGVIDLFTLILSWWNARERASNEARRVKALRTKIS